MILTKGVHLKYSGAFKKVNLYTTQKRPLIKSGRFCVVEMIRFYGRHFLDYFAVFYIKIYHLRYKNA